VLAAMETIPVWLPLLFFLVAFLYSIVGFGGGSSYLAILVLAGLTYQTIPPIALLCNLIVVTGGFIHFYRAGHFNLNRVLPFVITSIPMAYWGGRMLINEKVFSLLLGFSLLAVAVRLFLPDISNDEARQMSGKQEWLVGLPVGALLGFLAGVLGIGGGIFLSPLLLLMRWVNVKQAAAAASFFILVNSIAGLAGQATKGPVRVLSFIQDVDGACTGCLGALCVMQTDWKFTMKSQIPNYKSQTNSKSQTQNKKFRIWCLNFGACLLFGAWKL